MPLIKYRPKKKPLMQTKLNVSYYKRELLDFKRKIKLNGKRLHPTDSVRCLGVKIGSKLNVKDMLMLLVQN